MGYFDGLASGSFKTAQDGRRLFFPWGVLGRGYAIASEQDYERLRRQVKWFMIVSFALIIGLGSFKGNLASIVVAFPLIGFYLISMLYLLPRLERSGERLSLQESVTSQARAHSLVGLWLLEIAALVFVGGGILMFIGDPGSRLIALASIIFFGLCAAKVTHMLVLRHRAAVTRT